MSRHFQPDIPHDVTMFMHGRRVLIIGGDARPGQMAALQAAFPTTAFHWHATSQTNASLSAFRHLIADPSIHVVLLVYGLTRTAHTKGTRGMCSRLGKPLLWCYRPTPAAVVRALLCARIARRNEN